MKRMPSRKRTGTDKKLAVAVDKRVLSQKWMASHLAYWLIHMINEGDALDPSMGAAALVLSACLEYATSDVDNPVTANLWKEHIKLVEQFEESSYAGAAKLAAQAMHTVLAGDALESARLFAEAIDRAGVTIPYPKRMQLTKDA